jgi:hypothetical protein
MSKGTIIFPSDISWELRCLICRKISRGRAAKPRKTYGILKLHHWKKHGVAIDGRQYPSLSGENF